MFDILHGYEISVFSTGTLLLGVDSVEISTSPKPAVLRILGSTSAATLSSDTPDQSVSITRYLVGADSLLQFTGSSPFAMSVHHNGLAHSFESGYLNEYLVNCAIGSVPKVTTNFSVYDEIVKITGSGQSGSGSFEPSVPQQNSIICTCDHVSTNRVIGFDLSISCSREPIYVIGQKTPRSVVQNNGLEFSASVQIDVDDAFLASGLAFLDDREDRTVSLVVKNKQLSEDFVNISIPNASLAGQSLSASADGGLKLTLNYHGFS